MKRKLLILKKTIAYATVLAYVTTPGVANIPDKITDGYCVQEEALNGKSSVYRKKTNRKK